MARVKIGPLHARKRKRILRRAKGFVGGPGTLYRVALEFTRKADVYAYEHRKQNKRNYRTIWITRLNAALKQRGVAYNRFVPACVTAGIVLNRKMLSELAVTDPAAFDKVLDLVKPHMVTK